MESSQNRRRLPLISSVMGMSFIRATRSSASRRVVVGAADDLGVLGEPVGAFVVEAFGDDDQRLHGLDVELQVARFSNV